VAPDLRYVPAPGLSELKDGLEELGRRAEELGPWGTLYADRARELALEAELGARVGTPEFLPLAAQRYCFDVGRDAEQAALWAEEWTRGAPDEDPDLGVPSDDEADPRSLLSCMRRAVGAHRLPFRVVVRSDLMAAAATGDGLIAVRAARRFRDWEVARIVEHEIVGHALPRARARREALGLFAVGTAGGSDDEEGRALLAELRGGHLCSRRKAELGRRHLAALAVRDGADWVQTVRLVRDRGATLEAALTIAARVHRGGGLAREGVYLLALSRVARAFDADPEAERWLERGRISVDAVPLLRELGEPPDLMRARDAA